MKNDPIGGRQVTQLLKNKKGTTLVELVVCMVLLSLFTVAAVTLIQPSAKAFQQIQNQTRAQNPVSYTHLDTLLRAAAVAVVAHEAVVGAGVGCLLYTSRCV